MLNTIAAFHHFLIYIINKSNKLEISALWRWSLSTNAKLGRKRVNTTLEGTHCEGIHSKFLCHCLSFLFERLLSCPLSCVRIESSSLRPSHISFYLFMVIPPSFMVLLLSLLRLLIISLVFPERVWTNLSISIMCKGLNDLLKRITSESFILKFNIISPTIRDSKEYPYNHFFPWLLRVSNSDIEIEVMMVQTLIWNTWGCLNNFYDMKKDIKLTFTVICTLQDSIKVPSEFLPNPCDVVKISDTVTPSLSWRSSLVYLIT